MASETSNKIELDAGKFTSLFESMADSMRPSILGSLHDELIWANKNITKIGMDQVEAVEDLHSTIKMQAADYREGTKALAKLIGFMGEKLIDIEEAFRGILAGIGMQYELDKERNAIEKETLEDNDRRDGENRLKEKQEGIDKKVAKEKIQSSSASSNITDGLNFSAIFGGILPAIGTFMSAVGIGVIATAIGTFIAGAVEKTLNLLNIEAEVNFDDIIAAVRGVKFAQFFTPIANVFKAIDAFLDGGSAAANALNFIGKMSGVTAISRMFSKVAWPISIIFAAFDAVEEFRNSEEGTLIQRGVAGIGGFLGDLVGAPFDILKSVVGWIMGELGFAKAKAWMESWSVEEGIKSVFRTLASSIDDIGTWLKTLWQDPRAALQQAWDLVLPGIQYIGDFLKGPLDSAISWLKDLWNDPVPKLKALWSGLMGAAETFADWMIWPYDQALTWISKLFGWIDPTESISLEEDIVLPAAKKAQEWAMDVWEWLGKPGEGFSFSDTVDSVSAKAEEWAKSVYAWVEPIREFSITDTVKDLWDNAWGTVKGWFNDIFDGLDTETKEAAIKALTDFVMAPINWLKDLWDQVMNLIPSIEDIRNSMIGMLPEGVRNTLGLELSTAPAQPQTSVEELSGVINPMGITPLTLPMTIGAGAGKWIGEQLLGSTPPTDVEIDTTPATGASGSWGTQIDAGNGLSVPPKGIYQLPTGEWVGTLQSLKQWGYPVDDLYGGPRMPPPKPDRRSEMIQQESENQALKEKKLASALLNMSPTTYNDARSYSMPTTNITYASRPSDDLDKVRSLPA